MFFKAAVVLCAILHLCSSAKILKKSPDWLIPCRRLDPMKTFNDCTTRNTQALFKRVKDGYSEIRLKPFDPLKIKRIDIIQGNGPVNIDVAMTNVTVTGLGDMEVLLNEVNPKTFNFRTLTKIPKLRIEGIYKASGRILVVPLRGHGDCWLEPTHLDIDAKTDLNVIQKEGLNFFNITAFHVKYELGGLSLRLNNLFEGAKELSEGTNAYLNENWKDANEALRPVLSKAIEDILYSIVKHIFDHISADFWVEDINKQSTLE